MNRLITFLFTLSFLLTYGKETPKIAVSKNIINNQQTSKTGMTESEAYKLLYENAKENSNTMVTTNQWVIGISIAFLLTILGAQVFFNWKLNKKEIDYIKKDLEERIGELKADLLKEIGLANKEQELKINTLSTKIEKDLLNKIDEYFESKSKISELNDKMINREIELLSKNLKDEVKKLQIDIEKTEGDVWKIKGVEANALSNYLRTALLQIEYKREVKYILDDIIAIISNLEEIHQSDYDKLDSLTSQLKESHEGQKVKILSLYKDKPVYSYVPRPNYGIGGFAAIGGGMYGKNYLKNKPKE